MTAPSNLAGARSPQFRGVLASITASVGFAAVYFVTPHLAPASAEFLWAVRTIAMVGMLAVLLAAARQTHHFTDIWYQLRHSPILIIPMLAAGALLAVQLWLFAWAPINGRGLPVALGYFLLPLVLVVIGKFLYKDRLAWWQWFAAGLAFLGVVFETFRVGGISWETVLVALGYPAYFVVRRAIRMQDLGAMLWEVLLFLPLALWFFIAGFNALQMNPTLWWQVPLFGLGSGLAMILYVTSSRLLAIGVFGLLTYLEPALLVVASILNGERITTAEWVMYGAVWAAVLVLLIGGITRLLRGIGRAAGPGPRPPID